MFFTSSELIHLAILAIQCTSFTSAVRLITVDTLPSDSLSAKCIAALTSNVNCARQVKGFLPGTYKSIEVLERACTNDCSLSLGEYQKATEAACGDHDLFPISETREAPASFIPQIMFYNFNRTCIKDEGRWCNVVHKGFAESNMTNSISELASDKETKPIGNKKRKLPVDLCDNCVIKQLQFQAGSPINDGFLLQSKYSSLTASCSKTGLPLGTSTTPFPVQPMPTSPAGNCTGDSYTIQAGDTCRSISQSQGVGTAWLLYDNNLAAFCAGFPTNGTLCIQNRCSVYTVQINDTCLSIASARSLSQVQVNTWNPILGDLCRSINHSVGDLICVSPPGEPDYTVPTITAPPTSGPSTTAAPVPTPLAPGTTDYCAQYHLTKKGEYCNLLVIKFSIALEDFLFLNPHINANCTNLWANTYYCVKPVGSVDLYPSHSNYVPTTATYSTIPFDSLPKATFTAPAITGLPEVLPLAKGTRADCFVYANADSLKLTFDLASTFFTSACDAIAKGWSISLDELANWNPSLQINSTDCAPQAGQRYCMAQWNGASFTHTETIATSTPLPIRDGATSDCKDYSSAIAGITCQNILDRNSITIEQFYAWNPAVGPQCGNLWSGYRYCIRVDDIPVDPEESTSNSSTTIKSISISSTATSSASSPRPTAPAPTQDGIAPTCNKWHIAGDGLYCYDISVKYGITLEQFFTWNPAVSTDCGTGFWGGYAYCVGLFS
ncbi:hypothetical protein EAF04_004287 [Stromatinia cepivora]|nr:hypothetical protein EAF04_004287 [Stromatinia cepivora]